MQTNFLDQVNVPQRRWAPGRRPGRCDPTELVPCLLPSPENGGVTLPWLRRHLFKFLTPCSGFTSCFFFLGAPLGAPLPDGFPPTRVCSASGRHNRETGWQIYLHLMKNGFWNTVCLGRQGTKSVSCSESIKYVKLPRAQMLRMK